MQKRRENDVRGLTLLHNFGWLRAPELGLFMWPETATKHNMACRVVASWERRGLVLTRPLPDMAGKAVFLSAAGARLLRAESDVDAVSGKDIGTRTPSGWLPPATWRHDVLAAGVLGQLARRGCEVLAEPQLRRMESKPAKWPDGLVKLPPTATEPTRWAWLEVEQSRKSGPQMKAMAQALHRVCSPLGVSFAGRHVTCVLVAYPDAVFNEFGHRLDHPRRVENAIAEAGKESLSLHFLKCAMSGVGVTGFEDRRVCIPPNKALAILKRLDKGGWTLNEKGERTATQGSDCAFVQEREKENPKSPWRYRTDSDKPARRGAGWAATSSAAKLAAATLLAN